MSNPLNAKVETLTAALSETLALLEQWPVSVKGFGSHLYNSLKKEMKMELIFVAEGPELAATGADGRCRRVGDAAANER